MGSVPQIPSGDKADFATKKTPLLSTSQILHLQTGLANLDISVGKPDGLLGPKTVTGIRRFQKELGLIPDGKPSLGLIDRIDQEIQKRASLAEREGATTEAPFAPAPKKEHPPGPTAAPTLPPSSITAPIPPPIIGSSADELLALIFIGIAVFVFVFWIIPFVASGRYKHATHAGMGGATDGSSDAGPEIFGSKPSHVPKPSEIKTEIGPKPSLRLEVEHDIMPILSKSRSLRFEAEIDPSAPRPHSPGSTPTIVSPTRRADRPSVKRSRIKPGSAPRSSIKRSGLPRPSVALSKATPSTSPIRVRSKRAIKQIFSYEDATSDLWVCENCHTNNHITNPTCEVCHHPR